MKTLTQTYFLKRIYNARGCSDTRDCVMNIHDCLYAIKQLDDAGKPYKNISIRLHKLTERYAQLAKKEKISHNWQEALKRYRKENNINSPYSLGNNNNTNMVTISNYFEQTKGFDFSKTSHPKKDALRQGHNFTTENHDLYNDDPDIKTAIDNHVKLVNEALLLQKVDKKIEDKEKVKPITSSQIERAIKNAPHFDETDKRAIKYAIDNGFVRQISVTQYEWTDAGAENYGFKPSIKPKATPKWKPKYKAGQKAIWVSSKGVEHEGVIVKADTANPGTYLFKGNKWDDADNVSESGLKLLSKPAKQTKPKATPKPKQRKPKYKVSDVLNWRDNDGSIIREKIASIDFKSDGEPVYTVTGNRSNPSWKYAESEIVENIKLKVMYLNQPAPQEVHKIDIERKFIKRYAALHGKTKSPDDLMPFLRSLQKAIADKTITKKSQFADEILAVQKGLIKAINMGTVKIEINEDALTKYRAIGNGEKVIFSVPIIKSFIALTGKEGVKEQAKALRDRIYNAEKSGMLKADPHESDVVAAKGILTAFIDGKTKTIHVPDISLRGLYGIVGETMPATEFKTGRVVSSSDFVTANFVLLGFDGKWKKLIGSPQEPFKIMMYGEPGTGKSSLALQLAHYLAKNHNQNVLVVSKEEGFNYTLKEKLDRLNISHPNLFVTDVMPTDYKNYKTVLLDSVNTLNLSAEKLRELYSKNPKTNFILVFQTTKDGKFRGDKDYEHDVDCVIRTEAMVAYPEKNRFGGKESIKIA